MPNKLDKENDVIFKRKELHDIGDFSQTSIYVNGAVPIKKKRNITLSEQVYGRLEHLLICSEIAPGSILTELEISQLLEVSRTPVREALRLLDNEGLVRISKSGIIIPEISVSTQLKLLKLRRVVEKLCVECAIDNMSAEDERDFIHLIDVLDEMKENNVFLEFLRESHHILGKASKNEFITTSLKSAQGLSRRFWLYYAKEEDYVIIKNLYKDLFIAILAVDKEKALISSSNIIDYLENFTIKTLL